MKLVAIYNLKGGVGKTTTAVNLGWSAARAGLRTLLWDVDPQAASTFYLRVRPKLRGGSKRLFRFRSGGLVPHIKASDFENLDVLPGDHRHRDNDLLLTKKAQPIRRMRRLLEPLRDEYDLVLVDCPPSIGRSMEAFLAVADLILVPVVPTTLAVRTLERTVDFAADLGLQQVPLRPFLTMIDARKTMHRVICSQLRERPPLPLRTEIHSASELERMGLVRQPVGVFAPNSPGARAYASLWEEVRTALQLPAPSLGANTLELGSDGRS